MAIHVYMGKPRQGKTFELVANRITPALEAGRRVLHNIPGLTFEELQKVAPRTANGELVFFDINDLLQPWAYPTETPQGVIPGTVIQGGEVIAISEAAQLFPNAPRVEDHVRKFFEYHGHFTDKTGAATDILLDIQDIMNLPPKIRRLAEFTFNIAKLDRFIPTQFLKDKLRLYAFATYTGSRIDKRSRQSNRWLRRDPRFYGAYNSFAGGVQGNVNIGEKRASVFSIGSMFMLGIILACIGGGFALSSRYFDTSCKTPPEAMISDGETIIIYIEGKEYTDATTGSDHGGPFVTRGKCKWRVSNGPRVFRTVG